MKLSKLVNTDYDMDIKVIGSDSRKVVDGTLYFCIKGFNRDGHDYVNDAIKSGAVAIVSEKEMDLKVPVIVVSNTKKEMNNALSKFYDSVDDKLKIIGVTGTDGKTTTTTIIYQLLNMLNAKCGVIGSNGILAPNFNRENYYTTPLVADLYASFNDFYNIGCEYVSIEVTSERLLNETIDELKYDVAILTNITRDHLNTHKTLENYIDTKLKLFKSIKENGIAVINNDDEYANYFKDNILSKIVTYGINTESDVKANNILVTKDILEFDINGIYGNHHIKSSLSGYYNVYNLMSAIISLVHFGFRIEDVIEKVSELETVSARSEFIDFGQSYNIILDYAHTANALKNLIEYVKTFTKGKVITVTGSAGGKDRGKRTDMGQVVTDLSDLVIFTADDLRDEEAIDIINEMVQDVVKDNYEIITDRKEAIYRALDIATADDSVIIAGRGNDKKMPVKDKLIDFSDRDVIKEYFN